MDAAVEQALAAGRTVIVPTPQRASALRFAWARHQLRKGLPVWASPDVLTWDAWLGREWQRAQLASAQGPTHTSLGRSQERLLWEQALLGLDRDDAHLLTSHASALAQSAARVVRSGIPESRIGVTEEEQLLVAASRALRERCEARGWICLTLTPAEGFSGLRCAAPLVAGQPELDLLQRRLGRMLWPDAALLAPPATPAAQTRFLRAPDRSSELQAVAQWCHQQLVQDGARRLLVVSVYSDPPVRVLACQLWSQLATDTAAELTGSIDPALLTVEGGESLLQHALIADALAALQLLGDAVDTAALCQLLLSPYLHFSGIVECTSLEWQLREWGRARWPSRVLTGNLATLESRCPVAARLADWLSQLRSAADEGPLSMGGWAAVFDKLLTAAGFPGNRSLDSHDAQRLTRWRELLDEFAALDSVAGTVSADEALRRLRALATHGTHEAASRDAAITLTDDIGDPLVNYDGIWVLGLSESQWPRPPRPNPFVPLVEQQQASWPEASVTLRAQQAAQSLACWRARAGQLQLSYAQLDADIHCRPSPVLAREQPDWEMPPSASCHARTGLSQPMAVDHALPARAPEAHGITLRSGARLLQQQQDCPFRAQAEQRLGAGDLPQFADGISVLMRGSLLHGLCEGLWKELGDQRGLLALTQAQRLDCIERHWRRALNGLEKGIRDRVDVRVLERERRRTAQLINRLLELEAARPDFRIAAVEQELQINWGGARLRMRVDRIDELADGSRLLIDYKSGRADRIKLDADEPRPLQLAAYVAALASQDAPVQGAALLSLHAAQLGFRGRALDIENAPRGLKVQPDWNEQSARWQQVVEQLLDAHLQGDARVAPAQGACRYCHLASFCRIQPGQERSEDSEAEEQGAAGE